MPFVYETPRLGKAQSGEYLTCMMGCNCIISLHDCFWKSISSSVVPTLYSEEEKTSAAEASHVLYIQPSNSSLRLSKIIPTALGEQESESWVFLQVRSSQAKLSALLLPSSLYGGLYLPQSWGVLILGLQRWRFGEYFYSIQRGCNSMQDKQQQHIQASQRNYPALLSACLGLIWILWFLELHWKLGCTFIECKETK